MNLLDKFGFYYAPSHWAKIQIMSQAVKKLEGIKITKDTIESLHKTIDHDMIEEWISMVRNQTKYDFSHETFFDFFSKSTGEVDVNAMLLSYHAMRFIAAGRITYKIRRVKALEIRNHILSIPAHLLQLPFKEFMISIPIGTIKTKQGSLVNLYVSEEPLRSEIYTQSQYTVSDNIKDLIQKHGDKIHRIIRCYGISMPDNINEEAQAKTVYYQFPVLEDEDIQKQFKDLMLEANIEYKDTVVEMFNLMLNFCAWLSVKDPDIQAVMGVVRRPSKHNEKKIRLANRDNAMYGYNYFDVGRIYDSRPQNDVEYGTDEEGRKIIKRFLVRSHYRAQWYGEKVENRPGTEQKIIVIKSYEKGANLEEELRPKNVEAP